MFTQLSLAHLIQLRGIHLRIVHVLIFRNRLERLHIVGRGSGSVEQKDLWGAARGLLRVDHGLGALLAQGLKQNPSAAGAIGYRETIDFGAVDRVEVRLQNLQEGKQVKCGIGPLKALPMLPGIVKDPAVNLNGERIVFPGELRSGSWLEYASREDCVLFGAKGELIARVPLSGKLPTLRVGENQIQFSCASTNQPSPRVKVTVFSHGPEL